MHTLPTEGCPGDTSIEALLAEATERVDAGVVDPARFDEPYRRHRPDDLLAIAHQTRPPDPVEPVVVHGAARLSSLLLVEGRPAAWLDLDRCGVGDPYRDLATLSIDLAAQVSPEILGPFLDLYGLEWPELVRMDFHVLVDQLLR